MSMRNQIAARRLAVQGLLGEIRKAIPGATASTARELRTQETTAVADLAAIDARLAELDEAASREDVAAANRVAMGTVEENVMNGFGARFHTSGNATYTDPRENRDAPSFFKDLRHAQLGDGNAIDRLRRNNEERALGNTGGTGGSGGEFAPPAWLVDEFVALARPGRVSADRFHHEQLPGGVSSVNLPRVLTGTTAAPQTTQNAALSQTDLTTAALSSAIVTIGGKQVVSQQLLDQAVGFDRVVLQDLAADYARQIGTQVLTGTGTGGLLRGYLTPASTNAQVWTQAAPTASLFYSQLAKLQGAINASRFASPDVLVLHPRRWAWMASFTDSTGRPLIVPSAGGFNSLANPDAPAAAGHVGSVLGMDVFTDPNIPINLGAGTDQDVALMFRADDIWLWESDLRVETFTQPYSDSLGVLFRCYNYLAMIPDRYLASLGQISGSGMVAPVFAG